MKYSWALLPEILTPEDQSGHKKTNFELAAGCVWLEGQAAGTPLS